MCRRCIGMISLQFWIQNIFFIFHYFLSNPMIYVGNSIGIGVFSGMFCVTQVIFRNVFRTPPHPPGGYGVSLRAKITFFFSRLRRDYHESELLYSFWCLYPPETEILNTFCCQLCIFHYKNYVFRQVLVISNCKNIPPPAV